MDAILEVKLEEMSPFAELLLVAVAKYAAESNESLLAQLCQNIQSIIPSAVSSFRSLMVDALEAAAFIELLFLVKCAFFSTDTESQTLLTISTIRFKELCEETNNVTM